MEETLDSICQRADSYKFLSECYNLPDNLLIQKVINVAQNNQFFADLSNCIHSGFDLESLKIDYAQLFVGPFKLLAPPYGSFYLEDKKFMGDSTIHARKFYENEGLDVVINDAPDHIAIELEFIYCLAVKQTQAAKDGNLQDIQLYQQKQKLFLCSHTARWLTKFVENIQEHAQTKFYKKLSRLTKLFIENDLNGFESISHVNPLT